LQPSPDTSEEDQPKLLDLGCCVAQELRSLAYSGIPSSNLYGSDLRNSHLQTSYELFNDRETFGATLVPADIFSPTLFEQEFAGWEGRFSIIHAGLFLHLFSWDQQIQVCEKIVRLTKQTKGSLFVGEMVGCQGGGIRGEGKDATFWPKGGERTQFLHDGETLKQMWDEVAKKTSTVAQWKINANFRLRDEQKSDESASCAFFVGEGIGWLTFSVERTHI
jgi:hypothetical protein